MVVDEIGWFVCQAGSDYVLVVLFSVCQLGQSGDGIFGDFPTRLRFEENEYQSDQKVGAIFVYGVIFVYILYII